MSIPYIGFSNTSTSIGITDTRIFPRTIENIEDFIRADLLPTMSCDIDFRLRFTDTLRLATRIHRREPVYLAQNTDQRQALEEFMQEWFLVKPRPPEYLIHVIIGRRKYTSPAPEELITGMDRQIQRETEEFTGD